MELNERDGGQRRFVLVQQPFDKKEHEKDKFNICQNVTAKRISSVIQGYQPTHRPEKKDKIQGLGGSFTYARVGPRLFGEYRDLGEKPPAFAEMAKYIFYTETSQEFDPKAVNHKTGKIGEHGGTSYYLLYTPDGKNERALDLATLKSIAKTEKNRNLVIYCEKIWFHRADLAKYERETGKSIRAMLVPVNLK